MRLAWVLFCTIALLAQPDGLVDRIAQTVTASEPSISPDGKLLAWTQTKSAEQNAVLHIQTVGSGGEGRSVALPSVDRHRDKEPSWSPDSRNIAFLASAGSDEQTQLWTVSADGSGANRRTDLKGYMAHPRWSRDGRRIAFLFIEGGGGGGPLTAAPAMTGLIDTGFRNQRITVLDIGTGAVRQVSPETLHIYDFDWSPDDKQFVVTAAPGPGDNNWWIAQIYTIAFADGAARSIYKPKLQVAIPRWSPDGKSIAFIEGIMSDEGFHGGDLYTMAASGGTPVNRTKNRKTSPSALFWLTPERLMLTEWANGGSSVSELSLKNGEIKTLWNGAENIHGFGNFPNFSVSADGSAVAAVRSSFTAPPEVWAGAPGSWKQMTQNNTSVRVDWGKSESIEWTSEGHRVQGWLLAPASTEAGRKHPMIVLIHGGPSGMETPAWPSRQPLSESLSAAGYFVFMPNPRGSYGQGEQFTQANIKDFGHGDLKDILAGVDAVLARYPVDGNRLGVTGWSYGGFMTMWTVTQTNRFRAAMAGAGIANWQSYYGQNLIDQWMIPFFGASVYDDPAAYRRSSPIEFVKNAKTPTLVLVGERDAECPAPQSYEFWHALRTLGVKTNLVVYAGEGHMLVDPKNRKDVIERTLSWFRENLQ